jgi:hypothetical protein
LGFHILYIRVHEHRWPQQWPWIAAGMCIAGTMLALSPLIVPMALSGLHNDIYRPGGSSLPAYSGGNEYTADLLGYITFPYTHILGGWTKTLYASFTGNDWEKDVYLGLTSLILVAWGFRKARGVDRQRLRYALGGITFFAVLASGDAIHFAGHSLPIYLPNAVLSELPFFANVRTPARAIVFVYLFLGIAVAMTMTTLRSKMAGIRTTAMIGILAVIFADFLPIGLETTSITCGSGLSALARDKGRVFSVLDLPFGYNEQNFYMTQQICHGHPIVQGVVSRQLKATLADKLNTKNLAAQQQQLTEAGVKYIVLHHASAGMFNWDAERDGDLDAYRQTFPTERPFDAVDTHRPKAE